MKQKIRIIINLILAIIVVLVWGYMFLGSDSFLSSSGFTSLKYFTVLSNIFAGVTSALWAAIAIKGKDTKTADILKFVSTVAVMVTFSVVAFFLRPVYKDYPMYSGANLWFHLLIPLAELLEFVIFNKTKIGIKERLFAGIPAFIYGSVYLLNIAINGKGEWPDTNDWYGFLNWGLPVGMGIFFGIVLISILLGLLIVVILKIRDKITGA